MKFYKVSPEHLISEMGLNSLRLEYKGRGRPKRSDYMNSDISPKQRARINKLIKRNHKPRKVKLGRNTLVTDIVLTSLIIISLVAYVFHSVSYAKSLDNLEVLSPTSDGWKVVEVREPTVPSYCIGEINSLFCNPEYKWDAKKMIAICMSEDWYDKWDEPGWKPYLTNQNTNGTEDVGICMINSIHGENREDMFIPEKNIAKAHDLWLQAVKRGGTGYEPWVAHNNGNYLGYIGRL